MSDLSYLFPPHQPNLLNLEKGRGEKNVPDLSLSRPGGRDGTEQGPFLCLNSNATGSHKVELGDPVCSLTPVRSTQGAFTERLLSSASPPPPESPEVKTLARAPVGSLQGVHLTEDALEGVLRGRVDL